MNKTTKTKRSLIVRIGVLVFVLSIVVGLIGCKKAPVQTGEVDQNKTVEDLEIKGQILFTVNNESGKAEEAMAPKAVVQKFMQVYPGTKVNYEESNRTTYPTRIASGDIGDVFWCDANDANNYMHNHNALMPLDSYIKPLNIDLGNVYSGALECGKIDGRLYMVPRKIGEQALIYNKDIMQEAGIVDFDDSVATPWEDFKQICRQITIKEDDGTITRCGAALKVWWHNTWQMFFRGFGGKWIDNKNHKISIVDSTEVMEGVNELINGILEGWLYPEDMAGQVSNALKYKISDGDGDIKDVCFKTYGAMTWLTRLGTAYDQLKIDWDFCPFPAFPTHNVSTGATGYVVYNRTKNPNTAAAFALFFLTEDGQRAYHSQTGGNVPLLKSLAEDDFWHGVGTNWEDKNFDVFVMYTDCTQPASVITQAPQEIADIFSNDAMIQVIASVVNGKATAEDAFGKLQTKANEKWALIAD